MGQGRAEAALGRTRRRYSRRRIPCGGKGKRFMSAWPSSSSSKPEVSTCWTTRSAKLLPASETAAKPAVATPPPPAAEPAPPREAEKEYDPDSVFAKLKGLKVDQSNSGP